jgi:hypothetical protein
METRFIWLSFRINGGFLRTVGISLSRWARTLLFGDSWYGCIKIEATQNVSCNSGIFTSAGKMDPRMWTWPTLCYLFLVLIINNVSVTWVFTRRKVCMPAIVLKWTVQGFNLIWQCSRTYLSTSRKHTSGAVPRLGCEGTQLKGNEMSENRLSNIDTGTAFKTAVSRKNNEQ